MHAVAIDHFGGPPALKLRTLPVPAIDSDEVLIKLHTSGVGGWDADMRGGWWPFGQPRFPMVLGSDGSGTVVAVGSRVRRFKVGDKVYAFKWEIGKGGFYAEYVAVPAKYTAHIPRLLNLRQAGAIPVTGLTALQGIDDALHLKKGQSIIIHGASGGVGTMAVQFAKLRGARVLAIASGRDGIALARRLGADVVIDGQNENIEDAAREFASEGVDCVLAFAGKKVDECLKALRRGGLMAYPNGVEPSLRKRKGLRVITYDGVAGVREFEKLNRAIEAARIKVPIAGVYPLVQASKAHQHVAGHVVGKIVLKIGQKESRTPS
jgi:NADPH:quinone reductase-like Zn-dependent oxidoreductase